MDSRQSRGFWARNEQVSDGSDTRGVKETEYKGRVSRWTGVPFTKSETPREFRNERTACSWLADFAAHERPAAHVKGMPGRTHVQLGDRNAAHTWISGPSTCGPSRRPGTRGESAWDTSHPGRGGRAGWEDRAGGKPGARGKAMCEGGAQRKGWPVTVSGLRGGPGAHGEMDTVTPGHRWPWQDASALSVEENRKRVGALVRSGCSRDTSDQASREQSSVEACGHRRG